MATEINAAAHAGTAWRRFGPFKSSGGNWYTIARDVTAYTGITCYKSSTWDGTYAEQDASNAPNLDRLAGINVSVSTEYVDCVQDGDKIRVAFAAGNSTPADHAVCYASFDMSADTWDQVDGTDTEYYIDSVDNISGDVENNPYVSINVRSDGDVLVLYNGTRTASKGTDYSRVYYARLESGTWTTGVAVGDVTNQSEVVYGICTDSNDLSTLLWSQGGTETYKRLTSGNALDSSGTASSANLATNGPAYPMQTATAGEALMVIADLTSELSACEYTSSAESINSSSFTPSVGNSANGSAATWDSTNSVVQAIFAEPSTNDRHYCTYDPSTNTWTYDSELAAAADHSAVTYSCYADGTTLYYLYTASDSDIWIESYTYGTAATFAKVDGVAWTGIAKFNGVAKASIASAIGVDAP